MPDPASEPNPFLPKKGNYRNLLAYRKAELVYDLTFRFCQKHLSRAYPKTCLMRRMAQVR